MHTSSSLSLAALEGLVHLDPSEVPADLVALTIEVPDDLSTERIRVADLPRDWARVAEHPACVTSGTRWARGGTSVVLRVPAAPAPEEDNILLNPAHAEFGRVAVIGERRFSYDPRPLK